MEAWDTREWNERRTRGLLHELDSKSQAKPLVGGASSIREERFPTAFLFRLDVDGSENVVLLLLHVSVILGLIPKFRKHRGASVWGWVVKHEPSRRIGEEGREDQDVEGEDLLEQ